MASGRSSALSAGGAPALRCQDLGSGYGDRKVLDGITFSISEPSVYVVLGPNGAGKTTLFRTIAGVLRPYAGTVEIGGHSLDAPESRERLHFLSHVDGIPDGLRVEEALRFYAGVQHASAEDVERTIALLEIEPFRHKFFSELSAGQKKRTAIARIFLTERDLYLLDEPTANLDPKVAAEIRDLILKLSRNKVVLYSSHNLFEAREIGTSVLAIKDGQLALFQRISEMKSSRYLVGIRPLTGAEKLPAGQRRGDYFVYELAGPGEVPRLLKELGEQGVEVREVKELGNPLEDLFA